jgi:hypothetical protein
MRKVKENAHSAAVMNCGRVGLSSRERGAVMAFLHRRGWCQELIANVSLSRAGMPAAAAGVIEVCRERVPSALIVGRQR